MKIKGFNKNLCCGDMQFEIGKIYDTGAKDEDLRLCSNTVFHYCNNIKDAHGFYNCNLNSRYCEIEVLGKEVTDGQKCGSNKIKIIREIKNEELDMLLGKTNNNTGMFNEGGYNSGDCNIGYYNSGYYNYGYRNAGYWNSGDRNSGNKNSGDKNSGHRNKGNGNSGNWNGCDNSNGIFCTKEPTIRIFDVETNITLSEFSVSKWNIALTQADFPLTEWVNYTDNEKANTKNEALIGGYLKTRTYKEACAIWWENTTEENKKIIMSIPNFDKNKFKQITGIEV